MYTQYIYIYVCVFLMLSMYCKSKKNVNTPGFGGMYHLLGTVCYGVVGLITNIKALHTIAFRLSGIYAAFIQMMN